jgi:hypothetical protein
MRLLSSESFAVQFGVVNKQENELSSVYQFPLKIFHLHYNGFLVKIHFITCQ